MPSMFFTPPNLQPILPEISVLLTLELSALKLSDMQMIAINVFGTIYDFWASFNMY